MLPAALRSFGGGGRPPGDLALIKSHQLAEKMTCMHYSDKLGRSFTAVRAMRDINVLCEDCRQGGVAVAAIAAALSWQVQRAKTQACQGQAVQGCLGRSGSRTWKRKCPHTVGTLRMALEGERYREAVQGPCQWHLLTIVTQQQNTADKCRQVQKSTEIRAFQGDGW